MSVAGSAGPAIERSWRFTGLASALALWLCCLGGSSASAAHLASRHGAWGLFHHTEAGQRLCFLATEPVDRLPKTAQRDAAVFYVTAWPRARIRAEVSIRLGYPIRKGSEATVTLDAQSFMLFAEADRVFVREAIVEGRLLEAMAKAAQVTVIATSERGVTTTDTYSLDGFAQGLKSMATDCP